MGIDPSKRYTAKLDTSHHIEMLANHYSGIIYVHYDIGRWSPWFAMHVHSIYG